MSGTGRKIAMELLIAAAIGAVLGMLGPFGTFAVPVVTRMIYWIAVTTIGYALFRPIGIVGGWIAEMLSAPKMIGIALSTAIASLPLTLIIGIVATGMRMDRLGSVEWGRLYIQTALMGLLIETLIRLVFRRPVTPAPIADVVPPDAPAEPIPAPPPPPVPPVPATPFLDRLPPALGRDLLCLEMEDHYVRAHTKAGSGLILMRLRDAMAELDGIDGAQTHRSWWVARSAVTGMRREGRAIRLVLSNGNEAPVAREQAAALRDAGWF